MQPDGTWTILIVADDDEVRASLIGCFEASNHLRRVPAWRGLPERSGQPAHLVLGQREFGCRDENSGAEPSTTSMRWPHAVARWCGRLCFVDARNNRALLRRLAPELAS